MATGTLYAPASPLPLMHKMKANKKKKAVSLAASFLCAAKTAIFGRGPALDEMKLFRRG